MLVLAAACGREPRDAAPPQAGPVRGGRFVYGMQQEPEMLNSILQLSKPSRQVNNAIFSRFVTYDDSLHLVPDLIVDIPTLENGGIAADGRRYTYRLRPDARWHDGRPVTSADVRFTYRVIMDPDCGAESQQGWDVIDSVATPDAHTVVFHLRETYANFVGDTFSDEDVLPQHLLEAFVGPGFRAAPFHRAPVGSGPFRFQEWVPGSHIVLVRFEAYHGGAPPLETLVFKFVPDANALAVQLRAGDLDGYDQAEASQLPLLQSLPGVKLYRTPSLTYEHVDFNCERPILADARLRRALACATDRAALAAQVYEGGAEPARADVLPVLPWYHAGADTANPFDPARARSLLEAAGWKDADGDGVRERGGAPLRLELVTTAGRPTREAAAAVLQQMWRQVGVDVTIRTYNAAVLFGSAESGGILRSGKFDAALFGWGQSPDPTGMEVVYGSRFVPPAGQNMGRFRHARLDSLAAAGSRLVDMRARVPLYRDIEAILLHEMPVLPLVWLVDVDPVTVRLQNYRPNPNTIAGDTWNVHTWWLSTAS